jgi:uncharacterized MAPEG superfamily protein
MNIYLRGDMMERFSKYIISVVIIFIVIYSIDSLFLRHLFWERLIVNIGIVLVFLVLFLRYMK